METLEKSYWIINEDGLAVLGRAADARLDGTFTSIDKTLDFPVRIYAGLVPDSKLYIAPSITVMGDGGGKAPGPVINSVPDFPASTIDFQTGATTGGSITITLPASTVGFFRRCALSLDNSGTIIASFSAESASIAGLTNPGGLFSPNALPIGWIDLECTNALGAYKTALSATNIIENQVSGTPRIVRIQAGGGGSGGSASSGEAKTEDIGDGDSDITVTFPVARSNTNYIVMAQMENTVDAFPQFQSVVVYEKTTAGFKARWNAPVDTANYKLSYLVPTEQVQQGEVDVPLGSEDIVIPLPITLSGNTYVVVAQLVNYDDGAPQYQPTTIIQKTGSQFQARWNAPTDSTNYKLAYHLVQHT